MQQFNLYSCNKMWWKMYMIKLKSAFFQCVTGIKEWPIHWIIAWSFKVGVASVLQTCFPFPQMLMGKLQLIRLVQRHVCFYLWPASISVLVFRISFDCNKKKEENPGETEGRRHVHSSENLNNLDVDRWLTVLQHFCFLTFFVCCLSSFIAS